MTTQENKKGCLITLTQFGEDTDAVAMPLALANAAKVAGEEVLLWLTLDGVELAKIGSAETLISRSFAPVSELLDSFIENGGRIGICPPCGKTHSLNDDNMIANAEWMGAVALLEESSGWRTLSF
ncbi:MAG: DsrE family protein [Gammaproteobacteria bacterium]